MKASSLCAEGWESTFTAAPRDGALTDAFYTGAGMPQPDRRRYIWPRPISTALVFFSFVSLLVSPRVANCKQADYSLALKFFNASSPTGPSAHTTLCTWSLQLVGPQKRRSRALLVP